MITCERCGSKDLRWDEVSIKCLKCGHLMIKYEQAVALRDKYRKKYPQLLEQWEKGQ